MRKFSATIIAAVVMLIIGLLWLNFQASIMQRQQAEAAGLVRWHEDTTWGLHQQRQNCSAVGADPCCWNNVALQQAVIDLQFEVACRRQNLMNLCRAAETERTASFPQ